MVFNPPISKLFWGFPMLPQLLWINIIMMIDMILKQENKDDGIVITFLRVKRAKGFKGAQSDFNHHIHHQGLQRYKQGVEKLSFHTAWNGMLVSLLR